MMEVGSESDVDKCKICNDNFVKIKSTQIYCSKKCNRKAHYIWRMNSPVQRQKKINLDRHLYWKDPKKNIEASKKWRENNRKSYNENSRKWDKSKKGQEFANLRFMLDLNKDNPISTVPLCVKQMLALIQIQKRKITNPNIINQIKKGETHEAYI